MDVETKWLRDVILGKITFRKCPCCDNNGREYWDENGDGVSPFPRPEWNGNFDSGECENCGGLGFIENATF